MNHRNNTWDPQLEARIHNFLVRKDMQFPDLHLVESLEKHEAKQQPKSLLGQRFSRRALNIFKAA